MRSFARWAAALIAASSMVALSQASEISQLQEFQLQERASVDILGLMPKCGLNCLISSIGKSVCSPTNNTCLCTNVELNDAVTLCVSQNCTIPEALVTKNLTSVNCDAPIRDQGTSLANMSIALAVVSWTLVLARLAYKRTVLGELSSDDIVILFLLILGIPSVVITVHGTVANGLGRDVWTLTPTQINNFGYYFYIMEVLYFANLTLLKLTLLLFYLRIFPGQAPRSLLWGTIAFVIVWGVSFIFIAIFQCNPISYFWTSWDGLHKGQCLGVNAIGWANAAFSIALDFWMLAIPLWEIRGLQLHWKKKLGVALMFIVGTFVTVVSILRLQTLVAFAASANPTYDQCQLSVWSTVEVNVGIFCACMPTLRLMLVRWVPALGSTNNRSGYRNTGDRHNGGTGGSRGVISSSRKRGGNLSSANTEVNVAADPHRHGEYGSPNGITYQKSYNVTYGDQGSQVNLRDLNRKGGATAEASSDISDF